MMKWGIWMMKQGDSDDEIGDSNDGMVCSDDAIGPLCGSL